MTHPIFRSYATISCGADWRPATVHVAAPAEFAGARVMVNDRRVTAVPSANRMIISADELTGDTDWQADTAMLAPILFRKRVGGGERAVQAVLGGWETFFGGGRLAGPAVERMLAEGSGKGGSGGGADNVGGSGGESGRAGTQGKLGEILLRRGVSPGAIRKAQREAAVRDGDRLGSALVRMGAVKPDVLVEALAEQYGLTTVMSLEGLEVPGELVDKIPKKFVTMHRAIPISVDYDRKRIEMALADPSAMLDAMNDIRVLMPGFQIDVVVAPESEVDSAIGRYWGREDTVDDVLKSLSDQDVALLRGDGPVDLEKLEAEAGDERIVRLVNLLIIDAYRKGASDIHIEAAEKTMQVRFRIDGVLYLQSTMPADAKNSIVARIKVMSDLKLDERRLPQDGRILVRIGSKAIDLRVSVGPTVNGEEVVLRLLDPTALQVDMTKLGLDEVQLRQFHDAMSQSYGMVLLTGPTGSGKTTTLYSALANLNTGREKIMTAENPVEFKLQGISQFQIDEVVGLTFASALKTFLRQDPDIIMVGEIRDLETAEAAVQAALTGHLVFSTLHTNDAPSTIVRLLNFGIEPFILSDAINLIAAQRLVRKICPDCKEPVEVPAETLTELGGEAEAGANVTVFRGRGCKKCSNSGYKGRKGLYEVMPLGGEIADLIGKGSVAAEEIRREAMRLGMLTLRQVGLKKVLEGITTIQEVLRVTRKKQS